MQQKIVSARRWSGCTKAGLENAARGCGYESAQDQEKKLMEISHKLRATNRKSQSLAAASADCTPPEYSSSYLTCPLLSAQKVFIACSCVVRYQEHTAVNPSATFSSRSPCLVRFRRMSAPGSMLKLLDLYARERHGRNLRRPCWPSAIPHAPSRNSSACFRHTGRSR